MSVLPPQSLILGNGRLGRYTPGNGKAAAIITDLEVNNLMKAVTDRLAPALSSKFVCLLLSAMAVALGYSPVTLYCPNEVAELPRVLLAGRGVDIVTKEVTPDGVQDASV